MATKNVDKIKESRKRSIAKRLAKKTELLKKDITLKIDVDYLECKVCGHCMPSLVAHVKTHNMSSEEYKKIYNSPILCKRMIDNVSGDKNPGFNHGGKFSPYSKKFIKYQDNLEVDSEIQKLKNKAVETMKSNGNVPTSLEYFMKKTGGDIELAEKLLSERQTTFSLDTCIKKYGEIEGKLRWKQRQDKWQSTLNSKTDDEKHLINSKKVSAIGCISNPEKKIVEFLKDNNIFVDTQFQIKRDDTRVFMYDIKYKNKIIEFNGDFWHCNPNKYSEDYYHKVKKCTAREIWNKDLEKASIASQNGYEILYIWETDYKKSPENIFEQCKRFLEE